MQFVPKTHVPLRAAVEQVADRNQGLDPLGAAPAHTDLHARLVAAEHWATLARRRGEPLPDADAAHLAELRRWRREREDTLRSTRQVLRQALGDGDLPSDRMLDNGRLVRVRPEEWRTDAGLRVMETGRLRLGTSHPYHETPVMIPTTALAAWLAPAAASSGPELTPAASAPPMRNKSGRPEREDWVSFDQEMMRRLALDGGALTLPAFKRVMKDWAAQNMAPVPDDRTIERRIDTRAPKDVFVPD
jgi:hypothetical protein